MKCLNLLEVTKVLSNLVPIANAHGNDQDGAGIDQLSFAGCESLLAICAAGAPTGSPTSFSAVFTLEDSNDGSSWATVKDRNGDDLTVTLDESGEVGQLHIRPDECRRHVRLNRTITITGGTSPMVPTVGFLIFGGPKVGPLS